MKKRKKLHKRRPFGWEGYLFEFPPEKEKYKKPKVKSKNVRKYLPKDHSIKSFYIPHNELTR